MKIIVNEFASLLYSPNKTHWIEHPGGGNNPNQRIQSWSQGLCHHKPSLSMKALSNCAFFRYLLSYVNASERALFLHSYYLQMEIFN